MKVVEKHPLWLRIVHWLNVPFLSLMIWSGLLIYWAYSAYPGFFPTWFYLAFHLDHHLADGLAVHFTVGWLFVLNGAIYLFSLFRSGHWREIFPNKKTFQELVPTILHDLGLKAEAPPTGKFNAAQKLAYTGAITLAVLGVLSGFAIYKPVQLSWLTACFGGYKGARLVHFIVMISFCLFILLHVLQVIRAGWNNFRAMVAGFEVENDAP